MKEHISRTVSTSLPGGGSSLFVARFASAASMRVVLSDPEWSRIIISLMQKMAILLGPTRKGLIHLAIFLSEQATSEFGHLRNPQSHLRIFLCRVGHSLITWSGPYSRVARRRLRNYLVTSQRQDQLGHADFPSLLMG